MLVFADFTPHHKNFFRAPQVATPMTDYGYAQVAIGRVDVAAARELRDRYLEQFNSGMVLPQGKYEVCRAIEAPMRRQLPEAA